MASTIVADRMRSVKVVLVGDVGVGKSSLVSRLVHGEYSDFQKSTVGGTYFTRTLEINENSTVRLEIWDTAGQDRYRRLAPMYYRGAAVAIVVYDITQLGSFDRAMKWVTELEQSVNPKPIIMLVGNKLDLAGERQVAENEGAAYARQNGLLFMETSAKTAYNVVDIFNEIGRALPRIQAGHLPATVSLVNRSAKPVKKFPCCF